jgi:Ca-activated chloride channel homolog
MSNPKADGPLQITVGSGAERRYLNAGAGDTVRIAARTGWLVVLLDTSWSMDGRKLALAKDGVVRLARDAIAKGYRIKLLFFNDNVRLACEFTDEVHRVGRAVGRATAGNCTNGKAGMARARAALERREGVKAAVLLTDGYFDDPQGAIREATRAKGAGIDIICIATEDADADVLAEMATRDDLAVIVSDAGIADALKGAALLLPPTT